MQVKGPKSLIIRLLSPLLESGASTSGTGEKRTWQISSTIRQPKKEPKSSDQDSFSGDPWPNIEVVAVSPPSKSRDRRGNFQKSKFGWELFLWATVYSFGKIKFFRVLRRHSLSKPLNFKIFFGPESTDFLVATRFQ